AHVSALMAAQVVDDDDAAWLQFGNEELLDPGGEAFPVDRPIDHARGDDEGQRFPMPVRHFVDQRLALRAPAMGTGHICLHPSLVDEDHATDDRGVYPALEPEPADTAAGKSG